MKIYGRSSVNRIVLLNISLVRSMGVQAHPFRFIGKMRGIATTHLF